MKKFQGISLCIALALASVLAFVFNMTQVSARLLQTAPAQETLPQPPSDQTLIYLRSENGGLAPLAFETATTPLHVEVLAKGDKRSYLELSGERAATVITNSEPRFYLFLPDEPSAKPPFLVRLNARRGARRVEAMAQKGYKGFAIASEDIIKPHYRVIRREGGMQFMEIRGREPLAFGEYAIIGTDLQRVATFRIAAR